MGEHIKAVEQQQKVIIVRLWGDITFKNLMRVRDEFVHKTKGMQMKNILFDLKEVGDTDSSGLAMLINLFKYMEENKTGGRIGLINTSKKIRDLLEISKTKNLFKEYTSERRAISSFNRHTKHVR